MDWVVLAKVVPDVDRVRFDPVRGLMLREGVDLFLNPFDQRALRVALDQRRAGERVTILSMGPPTAATALREARQLGADRAVLLSDPALAGSDTLVTGRVLAHALRSLSPAIVLAGRWTTDSDTGQVPAQVAARAGLPVLTDARGLTRGESGELVVEVDTETGWARARAPAPALISVGEKITKIRKLLPEEAAAAQHLEIETWDLPRLGLARDEVGLAASPTCVEGLVDEAPARTPRIYSEGTVAARVSSALAGIEGGMADAPEPPMDAEQPPSGAPVFQVVVSGRMGETDPHSLPILSEVRRALPGVRPVAVGVGPAPSAQALDAMASAGAAGLAWADRAPGRVSPKTLAATLDEALQSVPRSVAVGLVSDGFGRLAGSLLAAHRGLGMTGDATGLQPGVNGIPRFLKPAFGGRQLAVIATRSAPAVVTVRPGALARGTLRAPGDLERIRLSPVEQPDGIEWLDEGEEWDPSWGDIRSEATVVVIGQGVGSAEAALGVRDRARRWGAAVGATRRVVDLGWVPRQLQIGLTGLSIAPRLAVLLGVGGSVNHLTGLRRARTIVAVNRDPAAPVFGRVDIGIVGEWAPVLDELTRRPRPG